MNNQTYTIKNSEKQKNSACGRSAQHWTLDKGFIIPTFCITYMTQFQIEGGGMVQGVTKLIMTFSTFFDPKT